MVEPALTELAKLVEQADSDSVKLSAIKDVLDRAGFKPKEHISFEMQVAKVIRGVDPLAVLGDAARR